MVDLIYKTKFKNEYPFCYKEYIKIEGNLFKSLNSALDSLLFKFGIDIIVSPIYSEKDVLLGHTSSIKLYPQNKLNKKSEEIQIIENYRKFKSNNKAQKETLTYALKLLEEHLRISII